MNFLYLFIVAISLIAKIRRTILFLVSWFIVIKIILNKSCFLIRIIEVLTSYIYSWPRYSFFDKEIEKEKERFLFVLFRILLSFFFFFGEGLVSFVSLSGVSLFLGMNLKLRKRVLDQDVEETCSGRI